MKKIILLVFITLSLAEVNAQIVRSVTLFSNYSVPGTTKLSTRDISAVGTGVQLDFNTIEPITISLSAGYELYSLQQDSALAKWNWLFWNTRYRGIVQSDTLADKNLHAKLNPVQKMDLIPILLNITGNIKLIENLTLRPSVGGGLIFYTRRMYLEEYWQKQFATADYTFEYSYRNFASDKKGNPFVYTAGLDIDYQLTDYLSLTAGGKYMGVIETVNKYGYNEFPFKNKYDVKLGLTFLY